MGQAKFCVCVPDPLTAMTASLISVNFQPPNGRNGLIALIDTATKRGFFHGEAWTLDHAYYWDANDEYHCLMDKLESFPWKTLGSVDIGEFIFYANGMDSNGPGWARFSRCENPVVSLQMCLEMKDTVDQHLRIQEGKRLAVMMGGHPRLGGTSPLREGALPENVLRLIARHVDIFCAHS